MWVEVNPQNSQKLEPAKFSCYTVADWNLRVRSNLLSCFINSKFLHECNQSLSWTQQSKVWNDLDSTITIKMFFAKISKLCKERIWHPTIPVTGGEFYMRGRGRWWRYGLSNSAKLSEIIFSVLLYGLLHR